MDDVDFAQVMSSAAEDAVCQARALYDVKLDYTEGSVQAVEAILERIYQSLPRGLGRLFRRAPSNKEIMDCALVLGAYLGEVMRRQWGGEWGPPMAEISDVHATLHLPGPTVWPTAKVLKRLLNGAEDNVWLYYRVLKADCRRAAEAAAAEGVTTESTAPEPEDQVV